MSFSYAGSVPWYWFVFIPYVVPQVIYDSAIPVADSSKDECIKLFSSANEALPFLPKPTKAMDWSGGLENRYEIKNKKELSKKDISIYECYTIHLSDDRSKIQSLYYYCWRINSVDKTWKGIDMSFYFKDERTGKPVIEIKSKDRILDDKSALYGEGKEITIKEAAELLSELKSEKQIFTSIFLTQTQQT